MNKILFVLFAIQILFVCGCTSVQKDNRLRISGIVDACKQTPEHRKLYLQQKVKSNQISQLVAYTIQECLKDE